MFAVVRHTYKIDIPEPNNPNSTKSKADWVHLVWIFKNEVDAITFAISLLDDPLIRANEYMFDSASNQLEKKRFYQLGRESVAIAEVQESPVIIYKELDEEIEDEESIH